MPFRPVWWAATSPHCFNVGGALDNRRKSVSGSRVGRLQMATAAIQSGLALGWIKRIYQVNMLMIHLNVRMDFISIKLIEWLLWSDSVQQGNGPYDNQANIRLTEIKHQLKQWRLIELQSAMIPMPWAKRDSRDLIETYHVSRFSVVFRKGAASMCFFVASAGIIR